MYSKHKSNSSHSEMLARSKSIIDINFKAYKRVIHFKPISMFISKSRLETEETPKCNIQKIWIVNNTIKKKIQRRNVKT